MRRRARPGSLPPLRFLRSEPVFFAAPPTGVNLLKIEQSFPPIHGPPWEYQFFVDVEDVEAKRGLPA